MPNPYLAQAAPTATVAYEDTARLAEHGDQTVLEVPVEISFHFTKAHSQRLGPASQLLWLRAYHRTTRIAPRLRIAVSRRVVANPGELPAEALAAAETLNATVHYNNIAQIRLREVPEVPDRYAFEFVGASQLQSYHAPDWALWPFRVYARERAKFTEDLGMALIENSQASPTPRTAWRRPLLEYAYDTFH
jgi:hypothetical protein